MSSSETPQRLLMNRQNFSEMRLETMNAVPEAGAGEVVCRIDCFGLTFNNITYATYGDVIGYWRFFPTRQDGWGLLPVWGYADVIDSGVDGIEAGQRYYGYWPSAQYLKVRPGKITRHSFRDDAGHRKDLPEIYNWYQRTDDDPLHDPESEPLHVIYRPLFITAFCLADFLVENELFQARQIIISSASSKTAYAAAFCLRQLSDVEMIGLTSSGNKAFVERLGLYSQVLSYDELDRLDTAIPMVYVDIAGNPDLQSTVHQNFGDQLVHDASVGSAQSLTPPDPTRELPGPRPEFFFAPTWIARRHADWGAAGFNQRAGKATAAFHDYVRQKELIKLVEKQGLEAAMEVLTDMLSGHTDPLEGNVIRL